MRAPSSLTGKTNPNARRLRRDATEAERLLWQCLRNHQLAGHKFRQQATLGPYIVDFLCIGARLVVEADGGQHNDAADTTRTAFLKTRGLRVLRFWNNDILANIDGVLETILFSLEEVEPSPNPLP